MSVRRAAPDDEPIVRGLRLAALADAPDAFESTLAEESKLTASQWRQRLSNGATFILERTGVPMGLVTGVPHRGDETAAFLVSMWLHPQLRGRRAGDALVAAVLSWARSEGYAGVWLHVLKGDPRARRFYERNGFQYTGTEITRQRDGAAELEMRIRLRDQAAR